MAAGKEIMVSTDSENVTQEKESKPKKKICCACPDTKRLRDECIAEHGQESCSKWIEAHLRCLRAEGFKVFLL
jgi:cytochrome c oxidase assembly protein subunit 17